MKAMIEMPDWLPILFNLSWLIIFAGIFYFGYRIGKLRSKQPITRQKKAKIKDEKQKSLFEVKNG